MVQRAEPLLPAIGYYLFQISLELLFASLTPHVFCWILGSSYTWSWNHLLYHTAGCCSVDEFISIIQSFLSRSGSSTSPKLSVSDLNNEKIEREAMRWISVRFPFCHHFILLQVICTFYKYSSTLWCTDISLSLTLAILLLHIVLY